ncbi:MAG TPA: hypothetical protein VF263_24770 [Longimicrobiaceae bacterium]
MRRSLLLCTALATLAALPAAAQDRSREPKRPRLEAAADTNSAAAYYSHGVRLLDSNPGEAAGAFYWASRLEPAWADPLYARRIAMLMSWPERLRGYIEGNRSVVQSAEIRSIDSLHYRALMLNPFLRTKFDKDMFERYLEFTVRRSNPGADIDPAALSYEIDRYLRSSGPYTRGWMAYAEGRFPDALEQYSQALPRSRNRAGIHADRARIFVLVGRPDSALAEMGRAVEGMRARDDRDLVFLYESKALYEHSAGIIHEQRGDAAGAREAYGRALQEDLSYYPAHVALSGMAMAAGDTATALGEMDLAVQIRGDDAGLRHAYGEMLIRAKRTDEAAEQLRRAIEAEPYYASPYAMLGAILESKGRAAEARTHYEGFLARAARSHPLREPIGARLAVVQQVLSAGAQP